MTEDRVVHLMAEVAEGRPPPADGEVEVLPQPPGPVAGILAFNAHHVIAADVDPAWVHERLQPWELSAPVAPAFVAPLGDLLGRPPGTLDLVLCARGTGGPPSMELAPAEPDPDHPRVVRAMRYRTDLQVYDAAGGSAVLIVGRGLAGRWEIAFEVEPAARGRGLGRALASAGRQLVPVGEPVFIQVAPGNVASVRAVLATGVFVPVGAEILFAEKGEPASS